MADMARRYQQGTIEEVKTAAGLCWYEATAYKEDSQWVFASPAQNGDAPHNTRWLQQTWLLKLGKAVKLDFSLGWHTFRHSYKTLLDRVSTDPGIKRDLMRHADIHTTMQVYGEIEFDRMRAANDLAVAIASQTPSCPPTAQ